MLASGSKMSIFMAAKLYTQSDILTGCPYAFIQPFDYFTLTQHQFQSIRLTWTPYFPLAEKYAKDALQQSGTVASRIVTIALSVTVYLNFLLVRFLSSDHLELYTTVW
jgi:hypothetical protein